jgi:FKBP-type peptidyl-prolyl cis-trans isomerase (trigger factor)
MHHQHHDITATSVEVKHIDGSRVTISATISKEDFDATRSEAVKHLTDGVELPGFRKGHVPEKILLAHVGEGALLEEMAEIAIGSAYPKIVVDHKIDALGRPEISISKIAHGNPLEWTATTAVFPVYTLPDYKALAKKAGKAEEAVVVTDEDVEKTLTQIARMRAQESARSEGKEWNEEDALPPIDDAYAKIIGGGETVDDLKAKLRENLLTEKERDAIDKRRVAVMDAILEKTEMTLPQIIVTQELKRMEDEFAADVARMGMDLEGYLKAVKKTKEELHESWKGDAEKRAKIQIIIGKIADTEKIEPEPSEVEREAEMLRKKYPDAPKERVHEYIHMLLTNDKVLRFLLDQAI